MAKKPKKTSATQVSRKLQRETPDELNKFELVANWFKDRLRAWYTKLRGKEQKSITRQEQPHKKQEIRSHQNKARISQYAILLLKTLVYMNAMCTVYFVLIPAVQVEYSSEILPKNEMSLPLKVINNSNYPIYNVNATVTIFGPTERVMILGNNIETFKIASVVERKSSVSFSDEKHGPLIGGVKPINGLTNFVVVTYDLPIIWKHISTSKTFQVYINKDNSVRWLTQK